MQERHIRNHYAAYEDWKIHTINSTISLFHLYNPQQLGSISYEIDSLFSLLQTVTAIVDPIA